MCVCVCVCVYVYVYVRTYFHKTEGSCLLLSIMCENAIVAREPQKTVTAVAVAEGDTLMWRYLYAVEIVYNDTRRANRKQIVHNERHSIRIGEFVKWRVGCFFHCTATIYREVRMSALIPPDATTTGIIVNGGGGGGIL
jgi:hypothetical protein